MYYILLDVKIIFVVHISHVIIFYCLICKGDLECDFVLCICISRFVPFLARRARFWLVVCGPGRFFGISLAGNIPGGRNKNTSTCEMNTFPL